MSELDFAESAPINWRDRLQARLLGLSQTSLRRRETPEAPLLGSADAGAALMAGQLPWIHRARSSTFQAQGAPLWEINGPVEFDHWRQSFAWLDDLAVLGGRPAHLQAQAWTADWLRRYGRGLGSGWTLLLTARRLSRLVSHADWLLAGEVPELRVGRLERAFQRHRRFLEKRISALPAGLGRVEACAAILSAAAQLRGAETLLETAQAELDLLCRDLRDLNAPELGRSPERLAHLFCHLAFSAQALRQAGVAPRQNHDQALSLFGPALRALRHNDGSLARFQSSSAGRAEVMDAAFAAAGLRSTVAPYLPMGYARLARGRSSVIADAGLPVPQTRPGQDGQTGALLAFEMTSGRRPLIVNCGLGLGALPSQFAPRRAFSSLSFGADGVPPPDCAPDDLQLDLHLDAPGCSLVAAHNGYAGSLGLIHVRRLDLDVAGRSLTGEDLISAVTEAEKRRFAQVLAQQHGRGLPFALRFHLHPQVDVALDEALGEVVIALGNGERWRFQYSGFCTIRLDPSVYLEKTLSQPTASRQIVLSGLATEPMTSVKWSLSKDAACPDFPREIARGEDTDEPTDTA